MRLVLGLAIATLLSTPVAADDADFARYTDRAIAKLARAGNCGDTSARWWCIATSWSRGTPAKLPTDRPLLGRDVYILGNDVGDDDRRLYGLVAADDGSAQKVTASELPLDDDDSTSAAVAAVKSVLDGKAKVATIPSAIADRVAKGVALQRVVKDGNQWVWAEDTDPWGNGRGAMRHVGAYWIVIYSVQRATRYYPEGRHVLIFTDAWK